ncbi:50S ribosomal protein L24 [Salinisphaera sp. USBA-960]|nr:50S ribosomal protein L24 [Salifodinibacter halophilus]NNC26681.1 50S ribosomal protein L24 [Salifodinibacter halophilus]
MSRIRVGDQVVVVAGRSRGQRGTVSAKRNDGRFIVDGVNIVKKTVRPDPNQGVQGGIEEQEAPIHASNVMIYNPSTKKHDRVGCKTVEDGGTSRRVRYYKSTGEVIDG